MGGAISSASDFLVNQFCTCFCKEVNHICRLGKNLKALDETMKVLKARRDDVSQRVVRDEDAGLQRLSGVDVWLTAVGKIENKAHQMTTACAQGSSHCEVCSKKIVSRFRYGKEVFSMLKYVKELTDQTKDFHEVAQPPRREVVEERALEPFIVGQETILESAWSRLRFEGTLRMGLCGMGGVGKTTLLNQINNKFWVANDGVDIVIWIVVSKDKRNEKIQDEIAEKLGFSTGEESWKQKTETQKASDISNSLKKKRFVLLLDDIWSKVELKDIGVPYPTMQNKCKIVFTTRSREVCVLMGDKNPIEVSCLDTYKAWELFKEKVGETTLGSHPGIPELARKVAAKCQGLPLALNVLGETMSFQDTIDEWRHAFNVLNSSAAKFSGMDDKILPILKYSYDSLKEEHVKQCFLYCSLFPEDFEISKDRLIEYWICEGFIQEKQGIKNAFYKGSAIISHLVRACLLLEESTNKLVVKMHDVVREMALWVASDLGEHKGRYNVQAGVGLSKIPEVENWGIVRKMSLMNNEIKTLSNRPYCPELTTLLLRENKLVHISGKFFQSMPNIVVLDLSRNYSLVGLPEQISELVSLRYLDLSHTRIKQLPVGLEKWKLIYLNLVWTMKLESISGISKLWNLKTLRVQGSKISQDVNLVNELEILENLEVLTIEISSSLVAHKFFSSDRLVQFTKGVEFSHFHELLTLPTMGSLSCIKMVSCEMQEIKIAKTSAPWNKSPASPCFSRLCSVVIKDCHGLKDLTWLLFAPNLTELFVSESDQLEDIISEEKVLSSFTDDEAGIIIPFLKLEYIRLWNLPMLKSIYWNTLRFPCLREINIEKCPNLRKLALDSQSIHKVEEFGITYDEKEWIENVEWEDEATKLRFFPKCRLSKSDLFFL